MPTELIIRAVAGALVIVGIILVLCVHINWIVLPAFVGLNLLQSAFTRYCPLEEFFNRFSNKNSTD